jgi:hypothetical protein
LRINPLSFKAILRKYLSRGVKVKKNLLFTARKPDNNTKIGHAGEDAAK